MANTAMSAVRDGAEHRAIDADGGDMTKRNRHSVCLSGHTYVTEHIDPCKTGALHSEPRSFVEHDGRILPISTLKALWLLYIPCSKILHSTHRMHFVFVLYGYRNKQ